MAMRWVVVAVFLALSLATVSAAEFEYTIRGDMVDFFDPLYALHSGGKVVVSGVYSRGVNNYIAILEVTPGGAASGTMLSLYSEDGIEVKVSPLGIRQVLLRSPDGYYLISEAHSAKTEGFSGILILKLDESLGVRWGRLISARDASGRLVHIYPRDAVLANGDIYILAKLEKRAVVIRASTDGEVIWARGLDVTLGLDPQALLVDGDGIYFVSTNAESAIGGARIILTEMRTDGTVLNVLSYSSGGLLYARGIEGDAGGLYIIGTYEGELNGITTRFPAVVRTTFSGNPVWSVVVEGPGLDGGFAAADNGLYLGGVGSKIAGAGELGNNVVIAKLSGQGTVEWAKAYRPPTFRTVKLVRDIWAENGAIVGTLGLRGSRSVIVFSTGESSDACWRDVELGTGELELTFRPVDQKYIGVSTLRLESLDVIAEGTALELEFSELCGPRTTMTTTTTTTPTITETATTTTTTTTTTTGGTSPGENGKTCGPGTVLVIALLPLLRGLYRANPPGPG